LKNVTIEQILVLIVFVLLPLLNWLLRRLGRRREHQPPLPPYDPERRQPVSEPRSRAPQPARDRIQAREAPPAPAEVRRREISTNSLFRTRVEMRRAIILMTILGPCRAADASRERDPNM
jgi:hypothetical protein